MYVHLISYDLTPGIGIESNCPKDIVLKIMHLIPSYLPQTRWTPAPARCRVRGQQEPEGLPASAQTATDDDGGGQQVQILSFVKIVTISYPRPRDTGKYAAQGPNVMLPEAP